MFPFFGDRFCTYPVSCSLLLFGVFGVGLDIFPFFTQNRKTKCLISYTKYTSREIVWKVQKSGKFRKVKWHTE